MRRTRKRLAECASNWTEWNLPGGRGNRKRFAAPNLRRMNKLRTHALEISIPSPAVRPSGGRTPGWRLCITLHSLRLLARLCQSWLSQRVRHSRPSRSACGPASDGPHAGRLACRVLLLHRSSSLRSRHACLPSGMHAPWTCCMGGFILEARGFSCALLGLRPASQECRLDAASSSRLQRGYVAPALPPPPFRWTRGVTVAGVGNGLSGSGGRCLTATSPACTQTAARLRRPRPRRR